MLKRWNTFNESVGGRFTEEMAMEIVYYFSESSEPSKSIEEVFLAIILQLKNKKNFM